MFFGVDPSATIQFSLVLAFFATCGLVETRRPGREVLKFEFDLASLWVGLTLVWMLFEAFDAAEVLTQMGLIGGIAGLVGAVLVARKRESPPALQLPALATGSTSEEQA